MMAACVGARPGVDAGVRALHPPRPENHSNPVAKPPKNLARVSAARKMPSNIWSNRWTRQSVGAAGWCHCPHSAPGYGAGAGAHLADGTHGVVVAGLFTGFQRLCVAHIGAAVVVIGARPVQLLRTRAQGQQEQQQAGPRHAPHGVCAGDEGEGARVEQAGIYPEQDSPNWYLAGSAATSVLKVPCGQAVKGTRNERKRHRAAASWRRSGRGSTAATPRQPGADAFVWAHSLISTRTTRKQSKRILGRSSTATGQGATGRVTSGTACISLPSLPGIVGTAGLWRVPTGGHEGGDSWRR